MEETYNMDYIILTQQFCETHAGYGKNGNYFGYAINKNGEYVCALNTIKEFPELFENDTMLPKVEQKILRVTDFVKEDTKK